MYRSVSKRAFVKALRKLLPEVEPDDVRYLRAGVRAQAVGPGGALLDDFHLIEAPHSVHVLNAPSPAATASITIGRTIAGMVARQLHGGMRALLLHRGREFPRLPVSGSRWPCYRPPGSGIGKASG